MEETSKPARVEKPLSKEESVIKATELEMAKPAQTVKEKPVAKPKPQPKTENESIIELKAPNLLAGKKKKIDYKRIKLTLAVSEKLYAAIDQIAPGSKNDYIVKILIEKIEKDHPELKGTDWFSDFK